MSSKKIIIAIVGMAGAGKTSACGFFKQKGFDVLRFGDQTDIGLKAMKLPLMEENEKKYRENLRKKLGMAAYAIKIEPRIKKTLKHNHKIILDGLYSWEEYLYLKKRFPKLILLCIYARLDIRYKRLSERKVRRLTKIAARNRDLAELINSHKGPPIAIADYLIINNCSLQDLYKELEKFLKLLK